MNVKYFTISHLERLKKSKNLNNHKINKFVVVRKMAEGRCYVCNQIFSGSDKDSAIEKVVEHMMAAHHGWIWGDAMQGKNTFAKCPVCGAALGHLYANCPNCGADLVEQYAKKTASAYTH